jgi:hypothetical protein
MYRGLLVWLPIVPKLELVAVNMAAAKSGLFVRLNDSARKWIKDGNWNENSRFRRPKQQRK